MCSANTLRIVTRGFLGGRSLTKPLTRRPPVSLYTMITRTGGYTYDVGVWDLFIIQGPIFCRAVPNPNVAIRNFCIAVERSAGFTPWEARGVARPA
jgi:hypothetical protein